jgi:hypothetical protein
VCAAQILLFFDKNYLQFDKSSAILHEARQKSTNDIVGGIYVRQRFKGIFLCELFTALFIITIVVLAIFAPGLARWVFGGARDSLKRFLTLFLVTAYVGAAPALGLLLLLMSFLRNVRRGAIFVPQNAVCLGRIAICCFLGAAVAGVSAIYYLPWAAVCALALFMGFLVGVVRSVILQACALQDDADLTI